MSAPEPDRPQRPTLGWLIASLTGGALLLSGAACSGTREEEPIEDIEVRLPSQAEADAAAASSIDASDAEAEYRKLIEEIGQEDAGS